MTTRSNEERELKLRLPDEGAWAAVREVLGPPREVLRQINTYFDTRDRRLLRDRALSVRVRDENGRLELTAKDRKRRTEGLQSARERTEPLSPEDWRRVHRGEARLTDLPYPLCQALAVEVGASLHPVGSMANTREVYPLSGGYLLELDRTELPGGAIDYEIEIELREPGHTAEGARAAVEPLLTAAGLEDLEPSRAKYARFLEALQEGAP